jgi:hypothetical protein
VLLAEIHTLARELAAKGQRWDLLKPNGEPYLSRYVLAGTSPAEDSPDQNSIWLHHLISADIDPWEHDHPFDGWATVLHGGYVERRDGQLVGRRAGDINRVGLGEFHRIESVQPETWTMFCATKTNGRGWGFKIRGYWVHWREAKADGLIKTSDWVRVDENGATTR